MGTDVDHTTDHLIATLGELNENLRSMFAVYMQWYVFFWTLNLAALAYMYAKRVDIDPAVLSARRLVAILFAVSNVAGALTSFSMILTTQGLCADIEVLSAHVLGADGLPGNVLSILSRAPFPKGLATLGLTVNGSVTLLAACVWTMLVRFESRGGGKA